MLNTINEDVLIAQIKDGYEAEKAFTKLMSRYGKMLFAQLIRMLKDEDNAKDVLQNVYLKIWTQLPAFRQESSFFTWAFRIARNEALNELTKNKKRTSDSIEFNNIQVADTSFFGTAVSAEELSNWLNEAISTLPEKQSLVFQLKYFDKLKFSEIAELTQTSEGALKASYHHASQKIELFLRNKLNHINP